MANTMTLISSATAGSGGTASFDFTSIPGTYTDLLLKYSLRGTANDGSALLTFNGSSSSITYRALIGTGSSAISGSDTAIYLAQDRSTYTASTFANGETYIPNYAGSNYKSSSSDSVDENNATAATAKLVAGLWSNTAAITRVTLTPNSGLFDQYSTAYLYGVNNA